jgi:hypothetical protein
MSENETKEVGADDRVGRIRVRVLTKSDASMRIFFS